MNLRIALSVGFRRGVVGGGLEGMTVLDGRGVVLLLPLNGVGGEAVEGAMRGEIRKRGVIISIERLWVCETRP